MGRPAKTPDISVGDEFDRLTVLSLPFRVEDATAGRWRWRCRVSCRCGVVKDIDPSLLLGHKSGSCGCARDEAASRTHRKHGGSGQRLYRIYREVIRRCTADRHHRNYGGRGITMCEEWRASYAAFRDWAMANGYSDKLQIDRRDNDGGYEPGNCRWVMGKQNCRNTRRNKRLAAFGETKPAVEWSEDPRCQVAYGTLLTRLRDGWGVERAIQTPSQGKPGAATKTIRGTIR